MSFLPGNGLENDAGFLQIFHYALVTSTALVIYEYFLTLKEEVQFMWSRRMALGKVLFFLNRYLPIVSGLFSIYTYILNPRTDIETCRIFNIITSGLTYFSFTVVVAVLYTRTYAVWGSERIIHAFLVLSYVAFVGATSYILFLYIRGAYPVQLNQLDFDVFHHGCDIFYSNDVVWIDCVILTISEAMAVGLLIAKSIRSSNYATGRLLITMVRDGVGYYVCNIVITVGNIIFLRRSSPFVKDSLLITQGILENILCNRLLLHVYIIHDEQTRCPSTMEVTMMALRDLPRRTLRTSSSRHGSIINI